MSLLDALKKQRQKISEENSGQPAAGLTMVLSVPMLATLALVLVCAVGWAFFMGFMVGRGEHPQAGIHSITSGLLPAPASQTEPAEQPAPEPVPEENKDAVVPVVSTPPRETAPLPPLPFGRPNEGEIAAWGEKPASGAPPQREAPRPSKKTVAVPPAFPKYDFIFQAAAFKSEKDAKRLQDSLKDQGMKANIRKSGKVFLVVVNLRGTENEADALNKKLRQLKLGKPLQLSKKPVAARAAKKR